MCFTHKCNLILTLLLFLQDSFSSTTIGVSNNCIIKMLINIKIGSMYLCMSGRFSLFPMVIKSSKIRSPVGTKLVLSLLKSIDLVEYEFHLRPL